MIFEKTDGASEHLQTLLWAIENLNIPLDRASGVTKVGPGGAQPYHRPIEPYHPNFNDFKFKLKINEFDKYTSIRAQSFYTETETSNIF